ncbi:sodium channel modifier 1 [Cyrtonyx montezumae]|uniref:sodium channel modifier 1 n=1 Tax=Cyrtonyx montezumae TaxID=9017 RepID=UPI0032DA4FC2
MSFKRDGDDAGQLAVLRKRRVADLLANCIPEDEALLLRSGKYACTLCPHRPIFDTLRVLAVHRAGRKHLSSLRSCYGGGHARDRQLREVAVGAGPSPLPHSPRGGPELRPAAPHGPPAPLLAATRRIARSALLTAAPYSSCCRRTGTGGGGVGVGRIRAEPSAAPSALEERRDAMQNTAAALLPGRAEAVVSTHAEQSGPRRAPPSPPPNKPTPISPTRRRELQRILQLRSAGWIQDRSGKWVKDENAEFDSDEEEPPALLPV